MSPVKHAAVSGVISAAFAYFSKSAAGTIACFLSGIFIDLDHLVDYWFIKKKFFVTYKELKAFFTYVPEGRIKLIFHSCELLIALVFVWMLAPENMVLIGLAIGMFFHMLFDFLCNPLRPSAYFFIYRLKNKFAKESLFVENYFENLS